MGQLIASEHFRSLGRRGALGQAWCFAFAQILGGLRDG